MQKLIEPRNVPAIMRRSLAQGITTERATLMTENSAVVSPVSGDLPASLHYSHSGAVPIAAWVIGIVSGILTAVVAGVGYAYADLYSPVDKLNAILVFVFGAVLGGV